MNQNILLFIVFIVFFTSFVNGQEILLQENFNSCSTPTGWTTAVTNNMDDGLFIGYPVNTNSDSLTIDGTCMVIFDDDLLGNNLPTFVGELKSPLVQSSNYQTIRLETDIVFRQYETSSFTVFLETMDGTRIPIREYGAEDGTGSSFSDFATLNIDLTFFTDEQEFHIVYQYDDDNMYAWWAGLDNVRITGSGEGTKIFTEQFNDCSLPEGWTTNILEGEEDWKFGYIDNGNAYTNSMNGTCFAYFDDDGIGEEAAFSTTELMSPVIDGSLFATFEVEFEMIFRQYSDLEYFSVLIYDGTDYYRVRDFVEETAEQFNDYSIVNLDLTPYRSKNMQLVFRYDDGNSWGWWVGIDNIKLTANGEINDLCTTASPIDIGGACLQSSNINAIFSGPTSLAGERLVASLWYEMTAPADGIIHIKNEADYNDQISIFQGDCLNMTDQFDRNHDEQGFHGEEVFLEVGQAQKYFVRVSGIIGEYGRSRGNNCISARYVSSIPMAESEDHLVSAKALDFNDQTCVSANNSNATVEGYESEDNSLARADVWYAFNNISINAVEFIVESEFAEMVTVYTSGLVPVHTELYGGNFVVEDMIPGGVYYVQVSGVFSELEGDVCMKIRAHQSVGPVNNICDHSAELELDEDFPFVNAFNSFSGIYPSCEIYADNDIWMYYTTGDDGFFYIDVDCTFENTVTIYEGTCDDLSEIWCGKSLTACDGSSLISGLEPNTDYFIQVASTSHNNNISTGTGNIKVSESPSEITPMNISVVIDCQSTMEARLQIIVSGSENYELVGHNEQDVFQDGDEYHVIVVDENGCEKSESGVIHCQSNSCEIEVETTVSYPTCTNEANGIIDILGTNGLGPYTYEWSHTDDPSSTQESLSAGEYFITVTDLNGCFEVAKVTIEQPESLVVIVNSEDETTANANDGLATLEVSGGVFPYTYNWSHGETTENVDNLEPGTYTVTITDYFGCENIKDVTINEAGCNFSMTSVIDSIDCHDANTGIITVSANLEVVDFEWSHGGNGAEVTSLTPGEYTVTLTADNGCIIIQQFFLENPAEIITDAEIVDPLCYGDANGEVVLNSGGGQGPFTYEWEDGFVGDDRTGLSQGDYIIKTIDSKACEVNTTITINQPDSLSTVSKEKEDVSCHDSEDGSVCVFIDGGTSPYTFVWNSSSENMSKLEDLPAGEYNLIVSDINGCTHEESLIVTAPDPLSSSIVAMGITGEDDGFIELAITGGTGEYDITWYQNTDSIGMGNKIEGLPEGIYYAVVTDENGCMYTTNNIMLSVVAIQEIEHSNFSIFPNPTTRQFVLTWENENIYDYQLDITSLDGKSILYNVVSTRSRNAISFTTGNIGSGIYYVNLTHKSKKEKTISLPLVIINK